MSSVFLKTVNMSIAAGWLILAVILARMLLKKAPKWIPCLLWGLVAIRLICPFSFASIFSFIPSSETIPANIALQQVPAIQSGITAVDEFINPVIAESFTPSPAASVNPLQVIIPIAAIVWIAGIVIMLAYALISCIKLKKTVSVCVPVEERILACDEVKAPFILGAFRPVIYVPSSMTGETLDLVIRHETAHLQRHDHWWKPLGYLLLAVYWFNPLCWIAYILLCRDIELACDEKVVCEMNKDEIAAYSQALLDCSFPRKRIAACPLAFGETGVKERVRSILNYRKPAFLISVAASAACIVIGVCFLTNPTGSALTEWEIDEVSMNKALSNVYSLSVRHLNHEAVCDAADINRFIAAMGSIKVSRRPVSKSRDEGRSRDYTITVNEHLKLSFNERCDEIWMDNGVKPSYTYRITNPSTARELLRDFSFTAQTGGAETDMEELRSKYPEYFDLSTFKGLELYVWQMAPDSYSCGLMLGTNRNKTFEELMNLKGASIAEMRAILSTYDIDENEVIIIPWQNPVSSYMAEYWIREKDEDPGAMENRQKAYIDGIRHKLFDTALNDDLPDSAVGGADGPGSVMMDIRADVCELYLEVLEDLWNVDSGLNHGISQIGIDLSELSHLTKPEKETVMREFASKHHLPYIVGTWEELSEQGYIDRENLFWEDGLFFSIKTNEDAAGNLPGTEGGDSASELTTFDAQKWRSGTGACFFGRCTAQKNADGKWSYTAGYEAIS